MIFIAVTYTPTHTYIERYRLNSVCIMCVSGLLFPAEDLLLQDG